MKHRYSVTAAALVALLAPVSAGRFASTDSIEWQMGNLFVGITTAWEIPSMRIVSRRAAGDGR
jgi:hypothetical protein